jgi:hypothetical protein
MRDDACLVALGLIAFGLAGFIELTSTKAALLYVGGMIVQFLLVRQAAANYGRRFVTTVLAEKSASTSSPMPRASAKSAVGSDFRALNETGQARRCRPRGKDDTAAAHRPVAENLVVGFPGRVEYNGHLSGRLMHTRTFILELARILMGNAWNRTGAGLALIGASALSGWIDQVAGAYLHIDINQTATWIGFAVMVIGIAMLAYAKGLAQKRCAGVG